MSKTWQTLLSISSSVRLSRGIPSEITVKVSQDSRFYLGGNSAKLAKQVSAHSAGVVCWKLRLDRFNHGDAFFEYSLHAIITAIFPNEVQVTAIVSWRKCHNYDCDVQTTLKFLQVFIALSRSFRTEIGEENLLIWQSVIQTFPKASKTWITSSGRFYNFH
jgi:hypothetical protein